MRDCLVIGAGSAGLSASLTLARARRSILVVDSGQQSNLSAPTIGGLLGHDGRPPADYYSTGRAELAGYPSAEIINGHVERAERHEDGTFSVTLADGRSESARTALLAPGMDYRHPRIPGLSERWGRDVFHCPFCHGWEMRDRPTAVLASGAVGVHGALNLRAYTGDITLLTNGSDLSEAEQTQLAGAGVKWDVRPLAQLTGEGSRLSAVVFADGADLAVSAMLVKAFLYQRSTLAQDLGATVTMSGDHLGAEAIAVDRMFRTGVPGLFAAGDAATSVPPSMAAAVASGYLAGASAAVLLSAGN
ncbi:NAD(P)/FAD-dependent oxidoreductase [Paractinoplanes hotanensis]|uniref:NAD(P)/FAD-dependent oxidoreductase n=1 Tax=Paractinoplanes hotanensis TaxID=2906497 RepID=A0ABT0Y508_9ACTN|nr:NAD(P)/FAD-dependent oxidoreductase [Actinoplanes hotanensis]MCM4081128.1 NAD(P)/FAD-dependent oxidoreductase [Actinoplanes hotanensis]